MVIRALLALLLLSWSVPAAAKIGTLDRVPAATLLFPHFEVDTSSPNGVTTILTLQNASATAAVANMTLWTDYGLPTAWFNVYLTGYDVETIDLGVVFRRVPPRTATDGQDPMDVISPQGPFSQDINFGSCFPFLPDVQGDVLSPELVGAHSGQPSVDYFGGLCGSRDHGDGIARGYVTVNTVNSCTSATPVHPWYFDAGSDRIATNQNLLLGSYVIADPQHRRLLADGAVHIEASATDPLTSSGVDKQTFYGRFVGFTARDNREPLPTAWAGRQIAGRTSVDYWRDPGVVLAPFPCGGEPAGLPSGVRDVAVFSGNGALAGSPGGDLFPFVSGSTAGGSFGLTPSLGWLFANLNLPAPVGPLGAIRQSWLVFVQEPRSLPETLFGHYAVPGIQLGNAATGDDPVFP